MTAASVVRPLTEADLQRWVRLYAAYASFYEVEQTPVHRATVWRWLTAADNRIAQRAYDRVARRTTWVTYDMPPP